MATDDIGLISVAASRRGDIAADHALLSVVIAGASLVTGQSALRKAREVKELADALRAFGLAESDIELEDVAVSTSSGTWSKSSAARYTLRIRVADLEALPDIIGIVAGQRNTTVQAVQWGFPEDGEWRGAWLDACLQSANARAERIARGLSVPLLGVHRFAEQWSDAPPPPAELRAEFDLVQAPRASGRSRMQSDDLGLSVSHTKPVALSISVQYIVGKFLVGR